MPPINPQELRAELEDSSVDELRKRASELDIAGRSSMDKPELVDAVVAATLSAPVTTAPQEATNAVVAAIAADEPIAPTSADIVGRPDLLDVAQQRAAERAKNMRVVGAPTQEA